MNNNLNIENKSNILLKYIKYYSPIAKLKNKLSKTDYLAIKYAEGMISWAEYEPIKQKRQEIRNEINILEKDLPDDLRKHLKLDIDDNIDKYFS